MRKELYFLLFCFITFNLHAQSTYQISNQTVTDCRAYFTDGDNGTPAGYYGHNENKVFHICVPGVDSIILQFSSFCTEAGIDVLTFHDGPDTLSPIIGIPFSGNSSLPPAIIARSGCLTIHFVTDASVACTGWNAYWTVSRTVPEPPVISAIPNQSCNANALTITLDRPILCDSVTLDDIQVLGPSTQSIVSITPLNCVNGQTTSLQIQTAPGFTSNGNYNLILKTSFVDACDSLWELTSYKNFSVTGCPLNAIINSPDTIVCLGDCAELEADAWGSLSGVYFYNWSNGLGNGKGPKNVCPLITTTYYVTVTDNIGTPPGIAHKTVVVIPKAVPPPNDSMCQTEPHIFLSATPTGGEWRGPGVTDANTGKFRPDFAGGGLKWLKYDYGDCTDSFSMYVKPMDAGLPKAACPGAAPFNLNGIPAGGTWSGTGITNPATGTFDPNVSGTGSFKLIYTNNICPYDSTTVNVAPLNVQADDTVCNNAPVFFLNFTPQGGNWTGSGITNGFQGRYNPAVAALGTNKLIYNMNGCRDTVLMTVSAVWAGWDISACPTQTPFALQPGLPGGGYWTGLGVDSVTGQYNPGFLGGGELNSYAFYHVSGCMDTIIIYNNITNIIDDTLGSVCPYEEGVVLWWETAHNYPWGGIWTGAGILGVDSFAPDMAPSGWHKLYYTVNGCTDSTNVQVFFDPKLTDSVVCDAQAPFQIKQLPAGGYWDGTGIVNVVDGIFSPQVAGMGTHTITYVSADNCWFNADMTVDTIPILNFTGLPQSYCFKDTGFVLTPNYPNGIWDGTNPAGTFNPKTAGDGLHTISYTIGSGQCLATTSASIFISPALQVSTPFSDTIICFNGLVRLYAEGSGGNNLNYNFSWNENLGNGTSYVVNPSATTTYIVSLSDGCSDADSTSIVVSVQPKFDVTLETDTMKCYELTSFVKATVSPAGSYTFDWSEGNAHTPQISALAGHFYKVTVTETSSGCKEMKDTLAPTFGKILADFLTTPAGECVTTLSPEVSIIDQSEGADTGKWMYGDGKTMPYGDPESLVHSYAKPGKYGVTLLIQNKGGCTAYAKKDVCVTQATRIIAPTGFSPNGDGMNDLFRVRVIGVTHFNLQVYNRWGELVFSADNERDGWDGTYKNVECPLGVFVYTVTYHNVEEDKEEMITGDVTLVR